MTPAQITINSVKQGKDKTLKFIYQNNNNTYVDVSGYTVKFHLINVTDSEEATPVTPVIKTYSSDDLINYFTLNSNGEIILSLPASETDKYKYRGKFELEITTDDATPMNYTLIEGIFEPILSNT